MAHGLSLGKRISFGSNSLNIYDIYYDIDI